ncbi:MAG: twin-arginine translocase TatA/TatE family subunit [FCB group bacterium]|nr:twin-arginine translocase TatA/TatE family subunit [FCB group bacterium]
MFGSSEIILIVIAILILFGGKRLPEIARNIGKGINALKREMREVKRSIDLEDKDDKDLKG